MSKSSLTPTAPSDLDPAATPLATRREHRPLRVLGLVGRGGMGEVYAAYDPELDRKVAVKLLRVKAGNGVSLAEGRQRTLREAQAIARLSHPNVVVVYDVGTSKTRSSSRWSSSTATPSPSGWSSSRAPGRRSCASSSRPGAGLSGGARKGARPPRLQARQRHGRPRRPGPRHGLRPRAGRSTERPASRSTAARASPVRGADMEVGSRDAARSITTLVPTAGAGARPGPDDGRQHRRSPASSTRASPGPAR